MNSQKITKDFKNLEKTTEKLIDKYNKSVDRIKSQELAISKVKTRLDELMSGNKTPTSVKNLESALKKAEKEISSLENQYEQTIQAIESKQFDLQFAKGAGRNDEVASIKMEQSNLDNQSIILATQLEDAKDKAEKLKQELEQSKLSPNSSAEVQQLSQQLDVMNGKLSQTKEEANQTKNEIAEAFQRKHLFNFGDGFNDIGKKIDKFKSRMTKLIGTAMVFNLLRNSLTNLRNGFIGLLKTNDGFSSSLNQIKANLMTAFAPIYNACLPAINSLMNAISKVTGTIAMFVSGLFGTSLEDAKNQAKGLSKALDNTKKSGEKASGSLASFDNLEVIVDSGGSNSNGIDYSGEIQYSQKLLEFLNKIKDFVVGNKDEIIALFTGITGALIALNTFGLSPIKSLGIGLILAGIMLLIQGIIDFIKEPSWKNFMTILQGIALVVAGIATLMGGWLVAIIAVGVAIVAYIVKNWDKCKEILGTVGNWIYENVIKPIADFFAGLWEGIKSIFGTVGEWFYTKVISPVVNFFTNMWNNLINGAKSAWTGIKNVFSTVATFFKNIFTNAWDGVKKVFSTGGKIFDGIKEGIINGFKAIVNAIIRGINKVVSIPFNGINTALKTVRNISFLGISPFKGIIKTINIPQIPQLATGTVIPPRQKFLAMLGDQRHGTNIEAPLETIKQANREVMQEFMGVLSNLNNDEKEIVFRNLTIVAQFGTKDFSKIVVEAVRMAEKEMGKQLFVSA